MMIDIHTPHGVRKVDISGSESEINLKMSWYASDEFKQCCTYYYTPIEKILHNTLVVNEVKMAYREYVTKYANCRTKKDSYDNREKTIIVYVPDSDTEKLANELIEKYESERISTLTMDERMKEAALKMNLPLPKIKPYIRLGSKNLEQFYTEHTDEIIYPFFYVGVRRKTVKKYIEILKKYGF